MIFSSQTNWIIAWFILFERYYDDMQNLSNIVIWDKTCSVVFCSYGDWVKLSWEIEKRGRGCVGVETLGGWWRRGEERRKEERRGEEKRSRGEERRGVESRGEERRGKKSRIGPYNLLVYTHVHVRSLSSLALILTII
jgi:hypothetical protein